MRRNPTPFLLVAWVGCGAIRILLGTSTSPMSYFFFGLFWLLSAALFLAAIRLLLTSRRTEQRVEAICVWVGVVSIVTLGLVGGGQGSAIPILAFLVAAVTLCYVYLRGTIRRSAVGP